jgi:hypothetical protein
MAIPDTEKQYLADQYAARGKYISVHTAAAGTTGANEATGGGYSRVLTTTTSGSNGVVTGTQVEIFVAPGTYVEGGANSASTGGSFRGSKAFTQGNVEVSGVGASIKVTPSWKMN